MLPVRPGLSIIMSIPGVLLRNGWSDWNEDMIRIMRSPNNFGLSFRVIRKNKPKFLLIGCFVARQSAFWTQSILIRPRGAFLNLNRSPSTKLLTLGASPTGCEGTLCSNETYGGLRSFSGPEFEEYLQRMAEEIIDRAVRMVIEDVERTIFKEEVSSVSV